MSLFSFFSKPRCKNVDPQKDTIFEGEWTGYWNGTYRDLKREFISVQVLTYALYDPNPVLGTFFLTVFLLLLLLVVAVTHCFIRVFLRNFEYVQSSFSFATEQTRNTKILLAHWRFVYHV